MTDLFGVPLHIGDRVIYTTGSQSNTYMEVGTITEFAILDNWTGEHPAARIKTTSGRKASNLRTKNELVSVSPIAAQHPELFV